MATGPTDLALGALASGAVISQPILVPDADVVLITVSGVVFVDGFVLGEGPLMVGLATANMSTVELAAAINIEGPVSPGDDNAYASADRGRAIRHLGVVGPTGLDRLRLINRHSSP